MTKIVAISDTHGHVIKNLPKADLLIHSGDWSGRGTYEDTLKFMVWMESIRHNYKEIICVPGNHERWVQDFLPLARKEFKERGLLLLVDEPMNFDSYKIYGYPWTPMFHNWAFNADDDKREKLLSNITPDIDILISHGPPFETLDKLDEYGSEPGAHVGCKKLKNFFLNSYTPPELVIFGHIHNQSGITKEFETIFVNAASVNEQYKIDQPYKVIYL